VKLSPWIGGSEDGDRIVASRTITLLMGIALAGLTEVRAEESNRRAPAMSGVGAFVLGQSSSCEAEGTACPQDRAGEDTVPARSPADEPMTI
jgi:hypothetical protein